MALDFKLDLQGFINANGGELGAAVVDELIRSGVTGQAGDVDNVTLLPGDHVGHEGFDRPKVSKDVDLKSLDDFVCEIQPLKNL